MGFKIVPTDEARKREYYNPWQKPQDASAWNNIVALNVRGANELALLPPKFTTKVTPRKHLERHDENDCYFRICVRCGRRREYWKESLAPCEIKKQENNKCLN
jgi:hypothetical protein